MAKLPVVKRFSLEDFARAGAAVTAWLGKLLDQLNSFMSSVYAALNNGMTFQDNMLSQIKTVNINGADPTIQFPWIFTTKPIGCLVINTVDTSNSPSTVTSAVTIDWHYSAGLININNITGLNVAKTYSVTFLVIGG